MVVLGDTRDGYAPATIDDLQVGMIVYYDVTGKLIKSEYDKSKTIKSVTPFAADEKGAMRGTIIFEGDDTPYPSMIMGTDVIIFLPTKERTQLFKNVSSGGKRRRRTRQARRRKNRRTRSRK